VCLGGNLPAVPKGHAPATVGDTPGRGVSQTRACHSPRQSRTGGGFPGEFSAQRAGDCCPLAAAEAKGAPYLPSSYRLDETDRDLLVLRRGDGSVVAAFSATEADPAEVKRRAWDDHRECNL
jgi:hypothetical protein